VQLIENTLEFNYFENVLEAAIAGIILVDAQGIIKKSNPAFNALVGYTQEQPTGKSFVEFVHQNESVQKLTEVAKLHYFIRSSEFPIEMHLTDNHGKAIPVRLCSSLVKDKNGEIIEAIGIIDVLRADTGEIRLEQKIWETQDTLQNLLSNTGDAAILVDFNGAITSVNESLLRMLGYQQEELIGKHLIELSPYEGTFTVTTGETISIAQEYINYQVEKANELFEKGRVTNYELYLIHKEGFIVPVDATLSVLKDQSGERRGSIAICRDITERKKAEAEIKKSKDFLEIIFKTSPDIIMINDAEGNISSINAAVEKNLGYSPEELIGKHSTTLAPDGEHYRKIAREMIHTLFEQGFIINHEFYWRKKHGGVCPFECSSILLKDDEGNVIGAVSFARDISERKAAGEKIQKTKEQLERFIENSIDPIIMGDNTGHVVKPNKAFLDMIGASEDEIIGKMIDSLSVAETGTYESTTGDMVTITEDFFWESSARIGELLETGKIVSWEAYYLHKSGKIIPVIQNISLVYDNEGKITSSFSIVRELTEQKKAEKELRASEKRFRAIAESSIDAIITSDSENIITFCNKSAEKIFGYSKEELIGQPAAMLLPERLKERNKTRIQQVLKQGITQLTGKIVEACCLRKNNQEFPVETSVILYKIDDTVYFTSTIRDITERKNLEEKIRRSEKMEAIGTLAGGVAHDLNNILSSIISYPELMLLNLPEDSPMRKPIVSIQSAGEKAAAIVNDLLTMARRGVTVIDVVNPNTVITEYLCSPQGEKLKHFHPKVEFEINLATDLLNTLGSPVHFSKTVMNLISNAAEALPDGGKVTIATENQYLDKPIKGYAGIKEGEYIVITVKDNGTGISEEDLSRIFEPFFTKKVMGRSGTGLGLTIVWGAVQDHNGYIDVDSSPGQGTTFKLYFPATRKEIETKKESIPIEKYSGNGEHILVVDDLEPQREIASNILTKLNYHVATVSSGEEAIEYLTSSSVDLVVLDMIMDPGIDGLETYKRILEIQPQQKAIIASGFSATERVQEVQRLGAGTYIKKPYMMSEIGMPVKNELAN
jgi:PAS domain S-box-containing protein